MSPEPNPINLTNGRDGHIIANHVSGAGKPGKTEFPPEWDRTRIITRVSEIATDTSLPRLTDNRGTPYVIGMRDGLQIRVNFYPANSARAGQIATAYPVNVSPNPPRN
jgi:hypothetical protein